jgi:hypothetical protein
MVTRHAANGAKHGRGAPGAALAARGARARNAGSAWRGDDVVGVEPTVHEN